MGMVTQSIEHGYHLAFSVFIKSTFVSSKEAAANKKERTHIVGGM